MAGLEETGPPPLPRRLRVPRATDPGASQPSSAVSEPTRARLELAQQQHDELIRDRGRHVRTTVAMGLAVAALAIGWRLLGPDED